MVGDKARAFYDDAAKERMKAGGGDQKSKDAITGGGKSTIPDQSTARDAAGKAVGVSGSLIDRAATVAPRSRDFPSPVLLSCRFWAGFQKDSERVYIHP